MLSIENQGVTDHNPIRQEAVKETYPKIIDTPHGRRVRGPHNPGGHTCLLCREGGLYLGMQEIQEHLEKKHGRLFKERWRQFSSLQYKGEEKV